MLHVGVTAVHIGVNGRCSTEWLGYYLKVYCERDTVFERNRQSTLLTERDRLRLCLTE